MMESHIQHRRIKLHPGVHIQPRFDADGARNGITATTLRPKPRGLKRLLRRREPNTLSIHFAIDIGRDGDVRWLPHAPATAQRIDTPPAPHQQMAIDTIIDYVARLAELDPDEHHAQVQNAARRLLLRLETENNDLSERLAVMEATIADPAWPAITSTSDGRIIKTTPDLHAGARRRVEAEIHLLRAMLNDPDRRARVNTLRNVYKDATAQLARKAYDRESVTEIDLPQFLRSNILRTRAAARPKAGKTTDGRIQQECQPTRSRNALLPTS